MRLLCMSLYARVYGFLQRLYNIIFNIPACSYLLLHKDDDGGVP